MLIVHVRICNIQSNVISSPRPILLYYIVVSLFTFFFSLYKVRFYMKPSLSITILMKFSLILLQFIRQLCNYRPYHWVKPRRRSHKPCKAQWPTLCLSLKHCHRAVHGMDPAHQDHHHHEQRQEVVNIHQIVQVNDTNKAIWTHFKSRATRKYCNNKCVTTVRNAFAWTIWWHRFKTFLYF